MAAKKAKKRVVKKAATRRPTILPMKLSSLIRISLKDIRRAEAMPKKLVVDMDTWFIPETVDCRTSEGVLIETHEVCTLCAAGSVMAFTLGALKNHNNEELNTGDFPDNVAQLDAINYLREGRCREAAKELWPPADWDPEFQQYTRDPREQKAAKFDTHIPRYDREDPEPFHKAMTRLQENLKKAGL